MSELEVPEGWKSTTLGELTENIYGYTAKSHSDPIGKPFLRITDIDDNGNLKPTRVYVNMSAKQFERYKLEKGDILIARSGSVGKSYLFDQNDEYVFASYLIRFRSDKTKILPEFLWYQLKSRSFFSHIGIKKTQSSITNINAKNLSKFQFHLPSLKTQKKIVQKLNKFFMDLDIQKQQIISLHQTQLSNLFSKKSNFSFFTNTPVFINYLTKQIISAGFEGKLISDVNSFDFEKYNTQIEYLTNNLKKYTGRTYHENVVNSFHSSLTIPKKWSWVRLDSISELISGQHILSNDYNSTGMGIPYITGPIDFGNISPVITKWTEKPKTLSQKNDVLITVKGNGVGKVNLLNIDSVSISRQLMAIRTDHFLPLLLYYFLHSQLANLSKLAGDWTTVPGIGRESILQLEIPLIPTELQEPTLTAMKQKLQKINDIEIKLRIVFSNYQKALNSLKILNYHILDVAFTEKFVN